ncbi:ATP synthase F1 subunit delta [Candidatus Babeliales bacterium]|nr:ATP synthase F1 subunit delta [Candidatus Babeliales bacterium]MBY0354018.1 ATP synthase F1 subunit delta [Candidatus Babeliales bacterium]
MILKSEALAKKYAQALMNLYQDLLDDRCYQSLLVLEAFFKKHKYVCVYLDIPTISDEFKELMLKKILETLNICKTIVRLIKPLLKHRRIEMIYDIVCQVIRLYRIRKNMLLFEVTTSHHLTDQEQQEVIVQLEKIPEVKKVEVTFLVDSELVCGIKIKGETLMWESSIAQHLENVKRSVLRRVRLW